MTRLFRFFMWSVLLIGLTSCGHQQPSETIIERKPPVAVPQKKPQVEAPKPTLQVPMSHKVGLLLPLTGSHAKLGNHLLQAAELSLFEMGPSSLTLLPQDTTQGGAHKAALRALDAGAELLLGPLFAEDVKAIRPLVASRKVNLISFSTDQGVAGNGVFILGFLPSQQINQASNFAKTKGLTKVAALTPEDGYGKLVDQTLKQLNSQGKIKLLGITHYARGDILEGNPGNSRIKDEVSQYKSKGLQALFVPEGGENLSHLLKLLISQMPLTIVGSGQWDTQDTLDLAFDLKENFFASPDPETRGQFIRRYEEVYGEKPPRIASLAYDAVALSAALVDKGYTQQNLTLPQGFMGMDGLFRLTPQGLNERGLAILEVTSIGFKTLNPAPRSF
ncbi:MAG: extracellular ligand-binding receptor [uncultured bacterium]|nr:MAG: extracellular ligand-binding receptor [uncultured bacterium]HBG35259.1 hypothetical protein [Holosporales bacterium]HBW24099.1 hypothetical protein [Holosporales bacterium]HCC25224.1 hypothetical protein [Holosporales bacterium]HCE95369.1 hypothetical protein [Holosporales bacterium]